MENTGTISDPRLAYLKGEVESASGVQLMVSLHNRLLRELSEAQAGISEDAAEGVAVAPEISARLQRCRQIVASLISTVTGDDDASNRMLTVYYTAMEQILSAEMEKNGRPLAGISPSIEVLRDRWVELAEEEKSRKP